MVQARAATATARPGQLSGGQRQRVALARAIVNKPKVLLLDEPLGALDLKLREQMQEELKALQKTLGITFIFVTHDQGEALSMADRVAVFNDGQRSCRSARPRRSTRGRKSRFVADFVGSSNVLRPDFVADPAGERRWGEPAGRRRFTLGAGSGRADARRAPCRRKPIWAPRPPRHRCSTARASHALAARRRQSLPDIGAGARLGFERDALHLMEAGEHDRITAPSPSRAGRGRHLSAGCSDRVLAPRRSCSCSCC